MKKKFKIIDASTGEKLKLKEGQMLVMNGLFGFAISKKLDEALDKTFKKFEEMSSQEIIELGREHSDEGHESDLRAERKAQLEADGPYDDFEFEEEIEYREGIQ